MRRRYDDEADPPSGRLCHRVSTNGDVVDHHDDLASLTGNLEVVLSFTLLESRYHGVWRNGLSLPLARMPANTELLRIGMDEDVEAGSSLLGCSLYTAGHTVRSVARSGS